MRRPLLYSVRFGVPAMLLPVALVFAFHRNVGIRLTGPANNQTQKRIMVFTAAGMTSAIQDVAALYETTDGCKVEINSASSAVLARQIAAGATWDVYVSANRPWMQYVLKHTGQSQDEAAVLAADRLALVAPVDSAKDFDPDSKHFAQTFKGRLAAGDPFSVPVGIYAKQTLENLGWWDDLADKIVPAVNVAAAQRYVETGLCDAGIIYLSSAKLSSKVRVVHLFEESLHDPICFQAVAKEGSEKGRQFLEFLTQSPKAAEVFAKNGVTSVSAQTSGEQKP